MDQDAGLFNVFSWFCRTRRRSFVIGCSPSWFQTEKPGLYLQPQARSWLSATSLPLASYSPTSTCMLTLPLCLIMLFFSLPQRVHRSSPKLHSAKPTDPIKHNSPCEHWNPCLQLVFPHLLALTRTFLPQIISPLSHGKIGPVDFQLIPADLFVCIEHPAIL